MSCVLRGFCRVRFPSGLVIHEIAINVGGDDGCTWASRLARPMIDKDAAVVRDQRTGKVRHQGLITFSSARIRNARTDLRALRNRYPEALPDAAPERAA